MYFDLSFSARLFNPSISPPAFILKLHLKPVSISPSSLILPWSKHHYLSPDYNCQGNHLKSKSDYVNALCKNFHWLSTITRIKYWLLMVAPQGCHTLVHLSHLVGTLFQLPMPFFNPQTCQVQCVRVLFSAWKALSLQLCIASSHRSNITI